LRRQDDIFAVRVEIAPRRASMLRPARKEQPMSDYMILIFSSDEAWAALTPAEMQREMGAYFAYTQALRDAGKYVRGDQLMPAHTAKSVRVREGKAGVVDGPYADTKEQFGGYYLISVADEAEALEWAAKCPGAKHGTVEVRACVVNT
jgi:hypothetical protein